MGNFVYEPFNSTVNYMVVGNYTQLSWRTTTRIGCGIAHCQQGGSIPYVTFAVCDYAPAATWLAATLINRNST